MNAATKATLRNKAHKLEPILKIQAPFTITEIKQTDYHLEYSPQNVLFYLKDQGVITKVDRQHIGKGQYHYIWEWTDRKAYIEDMIDNNADLPCGCRGHIPDMRDSPEGKGCCKHCGAEHDKETFKNSL